MCLKTILKAVLLLFPDDKKLKKNCIMKWNLLLNFYDKVKLIERNDVCHYDNTKNYAFEKNEMKKNMTILLKMKIAP